MKINVVTLCSGYDAMCMALKRLRDNYPQFDFDLMAWSEIAPNAIKAHQAVHPEYADRNLGDMTTCDYSNIIRRCKHVDLLIYSTPCQSVSRAGARKGMKEGDDAASALIWHTKRAIETLKPQVLILENVQGMVDSVNLPDFRKWQDTLADYGYTNFTQLLNSRDYGVAQNRPRVFMVSILGDNPQYFFPKKMPLTKRIKDYLEPSVDEKFYLSQKQIEALFSHTDKKKSQGCGFDSQLRAGGGISPSITTHCGMRQTDAYLVETDRIMKIGQICKGQDGIVVDSGGITPCICVEHGCVPKILAVDE